MQRPTDVNALLYKYEETISLSVLNCITEEEEKKTYYFPTTY